MLSPVVTCRSSLFVDQNAAGDLLQSGRRKSAQILKLSSSRIKPTSRLLALRESVELLWLNHQAPTSGDSSHYKYLLTYLQTDIATIIYGDSIHLMFPSLFLYPLFPHRFRYTDYPILHTGFKTLTIRSYVPASIRGSFAYAQLIVCDMRRLTAAAVTAAVALIVTSVAAAVAAVPMIV